MSLPTFGVTYTTVRDNHFPQLSNFSASSGLAAATVTEMVKDSAAELAGKLVVKGITPSAIDSSSHPIAYQWCAETVRLGAACRAIKAMTNADPAVAKSWQDRLDARLKSLDENGAEALGDAPATANANGPLTHINNHSLQTQLDGDEPSNSIPYLRGDDDL